MTEPIHIQFENAVRKALEDFKRRLEQQRFFQIQNNLLKELHEKIKEINYCDFQILEKMSLEYEDFYAKLSGSGRSYENIVEEKKIWWIPTVLLKNFYLIVFMPYILFFPNIWENRKR